MNCNVNTKTKFNQKSTNLTPKGYDILLVSFLPHVVVYDFILKLCLIMFPQVVDDPEVDEEFHKHQGLTYNIRRES